MHVRFEQDDQLDEPEVVIRAAAPSAETQRLQQLLAAHTITAYRDSKSSSLIQRHHLCPNRRTHRPSTYRRPNLPIKGAVIRAGGQSPRLLCPRR